MIPLVIDRGMPVWDAMELSRTTVHRQWFQTFGLLLAAGLLILLSAMALGIGLVLVFATMASHLDAVGKWFAQSYPVLELIWIRYTVLFLAFAAALGWRYGFVRGAVGSCLPLVILVVAELVREAAGGTGGGPAASTRSSSSTSEVLATLAGMRNALARIPPGRILPKPRVRMRCAFVSAR